ncbi:MAG: riboflavin transporter FmnP [Bacillales bacterium]|jgi:ECF transporter S component (folate family)|nr:riboflavin transporter FmnP [Bacillales bacterium]
MGFLYAKISLINHQDRARGEQMNRNKKTKKLVQLSMLSAIAYILMLFSFSILPSSPYLKVDFSEIPVLIAAFIFGPLGGILVELLKNILDYMFRGEFTGFPVGHLANFAAGILFVLPVTYIFNRNRSIKSLIFGLALGTLTMTVLMMVLNYLVFLPMYTYFLNYPTQNSKELIDLLVKAIMPFNLIKGILVSIVFVAIYSKLKKWIELQIEK